MLVNCPISHYIPDKDFLIKRFNFSRPNQRNRLFLRFNKKKFNSLAKNVDVLEARGKWGMENDDSNVDLSSAEIKERIIISEMSKNYKYIIVNEILGEEEKSKNQIDMEESYPDENKNFLGNLSRFDSNERIPSMQFIHNKKKNPSFKLKPKDDDCLFLYDFDKIKCFPNYFVEGNLDKIVLPKKLPHHDRSSLRFLSKRNLESSKFKPPPKPLEKMKKSDNTQKLNFQ